MKKKDLKIGKIVARSLVYVIMFGLFIGFIVFLNQSAQEEVKEYMTWQPEAQQGFPQGW